MLWDGHICFQYITLAYLQKYFVYDAIKSHILGRRLGSMELMILLLGKIVCRPFIAVDYLPSLPQVKE